MTNKLLLYLFIFTLLSAIFIYVNDKKILEAQNEDLVSLEARIEAMEEENESLKSANKNSGYFSLENNEDAITYFEEMGLEISTLLPEIEDEVISQNKAGEDNALVPYVGMEGNMRINKIKILNHKWIIADFTDGTYWGEVFLTYEIDENGKINFTPEKSFLYPKP